MKAFVASAAVIAVAALSLMALWRALRAWSALQNLDGSAGMEPINDHARTLLQDEKLRHLKSLKEVEFDHRTGKLDERDYERLRGRHEVAAAEAIRALDALDAQGAEDAQGAPDTVDAVQEPGAAQEER